MMAGFGSKCGADDEEEGTTHSQRTSCDLPAVEGDGLFYDFGFQGGDLLFGFNERIRPFGEPACVNRGKGQTQEGDEDEVLHSLMGCLKGVDLDQEIHPL